MNLVRELRKMAGLQQKEVAIAAGVSRPTVSAFPSRARVRAYTTPIIYIYIA